VGAGTTHSSVESAESDFRRHASGNGLFAHYLRLEGSHPLELAYPPTPKGRGNGRSGRSRTCEPLASGRSVGRWLQYQAPARSSTLEEEAALSAGM
jgi:hypothetical protein